MFGNLGGAELLVISVVVMVFFGSKKLNDLARGMGQSSKEIKKLKKEYSTIMSDDIDSLDTPNQDAKEETNKEKSNKEPERPPANTVLSSEGGEK